MAKYLVDVSSTTVNTYEVDGVDSPEEAGERYADTGIIIHSETVGPTVQVVNLA